MAASYVCNLVINTYSDFSQNFYLDSDATNSPLDLTGYKIASQIRKHPASSKSVGFAATVVDPLTGHIRVGLSSSQTASLKPGRYLYDLIISDVSGKVSRAVEGMVLVREGITR